MHYLNDAKMLLMASPSLLALLDFQMVYLYEKQSMLINILGAKNKFTVKLLNGFIYWRSILECHLRDMPYVADPYIWPTWYTVLIVGLHLINNKRTSALVLGDPSAYNLFLLLIVQSCWNFQRWCASGSVVQSENFSSKYWDLSRN